ncbi:transport protein sec9 [Paracoccidioides lutzii Pb01]|uniref:Transport protein sec9 n=1 Tax=Paracoccidioides lutzii (strain ATCC MYA-826 / Pb01) TaxID=502779 RepID=C1H4N7_PARBA|nr:transport protein sec9 [Paracoccidioides lutzii Pb01]EEH34681.1 transport protein sec9 [Paracoccidioides lutzii Pb01]
MKKFGFGSKKNDGGDDESTRSALFGSKSKNKSSASSNPYAQPPPSGDPYSQGRGPVAGGYGLPSGPRQSHPGMNPPGLPANPAPRNPYENLDNKYGRANGGYAPGGPGYQSGYGGDRYGRDDSAPVAKSRYGPGGYGGLGRADPNDFSSVDDNRDALLGDARERMQERRYNPALQDVPQDGFSGAAANDADTAYGPTYQERQLTAEEEEEEDIQATKQEIRMVKQQDVSSTRNALRAALEAEETGRNTLIRLGAQGERIHNAEKNLDLASNQNKIADERSRELKKLNKSMFAMNVSNPFTGEQRRRARDEAIIERHQEERAQREATRKAAFRSEQRMDQTFKGLAKKANSAPQKETRLADRAKYQFEADSEDDEMENEIESNLTAIEGVTGRLNMLARAQGKEVEQQNEHLSRIMGKSDYVDDQIHINSARLGRIH